MDQSYDYDVIVIGAGITGMVSAVTANGLGKRTVVVEKRKVGGNGTNSTCIPSKTLIRLSHTNDEIVRLASLDLLVGDIHPASKPSFIKPVFPGKRTHPPGGWRREATEAVQKSQLHSAFWLTRRPVGSPA